MCPAAEAVKLYSALAHLGRDVDLALYHGEGHVPDEWNRRNAIDATDRILAFLDQHLTGTGPGRQERDNHGDDTG